MSHLSRIVDEVTRDNWGSVDRDQIRAIVTRGIKFRLAGVDRETDRARIGAIMDDLAKEEGTRTGIPLLTIVQIVIALIRVWLSLTQDEKDQVFAELERETPTPRDPIFEGLPPPPPEDPA